MKLVRANREELKFYKRTKWVALIREFLDSDMDCASVEGYTNKDASNATSAIKASIKRYGFARVHACCVNGKVYLVKEI